MALKAMRRAYASDEVREIMEARLKAQRDEATRVSRARRAGIEEGIQQGLIQVAQTMLRNGMDWETITRSTGLRPEDLP